MQSLWRTTWLRVFFVLLPLFLATHLMGQNVVGALLGVALAGLLGFTSLWGLFHLRRVIALRTEALRDALLASLVLFLLFRGILEVSQAERGSSFLNQPIFGPLFYSLASGAISIVLFPILLCFNLTLVALAAMTYPRDPQSERSILSVFWPTLFTSLMLDLLLRRQSFWPSMGATLLSPVSALLLVRTLRHYGQDAQSFSYHLTQLLQRRCTRRRGRGPRDFRGIVLGLLAGGLTLCLATPMLHSFVAPYEGAAYTSATQLGNHFVALRSFMASKEILEPNQNSLLGEIALDNKKLQILKRIVVVTYDDPARRLAHEKSEAQVQIALLGQLSPTRPAAIALALPPENDAGQPDYLSNTTPLVTEASIAKNTLDFPRLQAAIKTAGCVALTLPTGHDRTLAAEAVLKSASQVGSSRVEVLGAAEAPAFRLLSSPPPLAMLLAKPRRLPKQDRELTLIDYRIDLQQIRAPLAVSQILQGQKLYDSVTKSWQTPQKFFADKLIFIEALTPRYHATPAGLRGEMEIQAQATATLMQESFFGTLPFEIMALLILGLAALVGHLCVGRAPLESLWRIALPILGVGGACFGLTAFGSLRADPVLPVFAGLLAFLIVTQFTFAVERDDRARNRSVLRRFLPPQIIEQMVDDPETKLGLGGKRRAVVVIFVDVRGFSHFAEKRTPEEVVATMNRYLAAMTDALNAHEGILDKYTGDGLMALFPVDNEAKDVLRAVQATQAMAQAAHQVAQTMRAEGGDELAVGMGLHYGEAVVGLVGHPTRQVNYTALGHTVVVAARLQSLAEGGEIILSEAVYKALPPDSITSEAGESVTVKGVTEPVPIYRLKIAP
ncbi:adenylate/guanylate cyclase domain-containing protein [Armatimonas sp.]|uniref:adenylate/guanylate cyclase domain-containing protein n=1 Tax=Armatimonas sp. TaxID=1872638 RepID=UPI00374DE739